MKSWKNYKLDDEGMWPKTGLVNLDSAHSDNRGSIQSLVNFPMKNISLISSKKGVVRSNHYRPDTPPKIGLDHSLPNDETWAIGTSDRLRQVVNRPWP